MKTPKIPFTLLDWDTMQVKSIRGKAALCHERRLDRDGLRISLVEYEPGYIADHWCDRGNVCQGFCCINQRGQLIDFRLTARRNANAARAFMRQASDTFRCYHPFTIITDKAHSYAKVIAEMNRGCGPIVLKNSQTARWG